MSSFTSTLKIENFKSIKSLELNNCKRINLFIGRPNVGKSNILEAISLFSLPYFFKVELDANLKDFIRIEQETELFFYGNMNLNSQIELEDNIIIINAESRTIRFSSDFNITTYEYDPSLNLGISKTDYFDESKLSNIRSYFFPKEFGLTNLSSSNLIPPHGENLFEVIHSSSHLKQELLKLFEKYNLKLVFDRSSKKLKITKGVENGEIFLIPFSSIADSLQRLIFFKTAIASNKDSIITFEEPEAHTYPPYIAQIAQDIVDSKTNQFFITTHSPYVISKMLESAQDELAINLVDFKDGQTVVKQLSNEDLEQVYNDGIDLFFNNELFL